MNMTEYMIGVVGWIVHYAIHLAGFLGLMLVAGLIFGFDITHDNVSRFIGGFIVLEVCWSWYEQWQHAKSAKLIREWEKENKFKQ